VDGDVVVGLCVLLRPILFEDRDGVGLRYQFAVLLLDVGVLVDAHHAFDFLANRVKLNGFLNFLLLLLFIFLLFV
jgi:hypothetical protein